jgi:prefoldin beta subunit
MADNSGSQLQSLSEQYQELQAQLNTNVAARQKLESQQQENKAVAKEFASLADDSNIYKLVGPVLLKQDRAEAVMAVDSRLAFIDKEIQRIEKQIDDIREKSETKKMEVGSFRSPHFARQIYPLTHAKGISVAKSDASNRCSRPNSCCLGQSNFTECIARPIGNPSNDYFIIHVLLSTYHSIQPMPCPPTSMQVLACRPTPTAPNLIGKT